ncbi:putative membrane protein [Catalinimonas alkaloidigena]|uniref:Putative membrane protein n=1 Tax=Catalinimonas alkaloidigena TaxID=1075417 RepID=A0A1G9IMA6_9BACT|nr:bestrophin family ion channel [Catalinimonas alkaloidigena]SDL26226.1 putative membrane protein [Catalinimonas alkaloidigena]
MLVNQNLRLHRFFKFTWKVDILMLLTCLAAFLFDKYVILTYTPVPTTLPALIGTAIAFFIGFNNNQAYGRWWEARIIWGAIVNDSRSWARNLLAYCSIPVGSDITPEELRFRQRRMIMRHIGFLYALKEALRKTKDTTWAFYLSEEEAKALKEFTNIPNAILDLQSHDLEQLQKDGLIEGFRFLALNDLIRAFCDGMGKSERINNTVFPTPYLYFTRVCIWIFIILVTMAFAESSGLWSVFFGWVVGFIFNVTHLNGMHIMNPFSIDDLPTGVPISSITRAIEINLLEALQDEQVPDPMVPVRGEYIF